MRFPWRSYVDVECGNITFNSLFMRFGSGTDDRWKVYLDLSILSS
jgi:hypothetical protein